MQRIRALVLPLLLLLSSYSIPSSNGQDVCLYPMRFSSPFVCYTEESDPLAKQVEKALNSGDSQDLNRLLRVEGIVGSRYAEPLVRASCHLCPQHLLKDSHILRRPVLGAILEKSGEIAVRPLLERPEVLHSPYLRDILSRIGNPNVDPFLKRSDIFSCPDLKPILRRVTSEAADTFLMHKELLKHPSVVQHVLFRASPEARKAFLSGLPPEGPKFLFVANLPFNSTGMFSVFHYLLGIMHQVEEMKDPALEIDFEENGLYYESSKGKNSWEYFFEPIKTNREDLTTIAFDERDYGMLAAIGEGLSRTQANRYIKKYFRMKEGIRKEIDDFVEKHFKGNQVIGVHYRGTDKVSEAPRVSYEKMISQVKDYIESHSGEHFKIFVATDEENFVETMHGAFSGQVVTSGARRSTDGHPLHVNSKDPYQTGKEALIDGELLSQGKVLIKTKSNLSEFSTYLNPNMEVILVQESEFVSH